MASKKWVGGSGAAWSVGGSWADGTSATMADSVTLSGSIGSYQLITGGGSAGSASVYGNFALGGIYGFATLSVGQPGSTGALSLSGGSVLSTGLATLAAGSVQVSGAGSRFTVTSTLALGVAASPYNYSFVSNTLGVVGGATAQVGSLVMLGGGLVTNTVNVDAASSLEIGTVGGAAAGKVTVDAGRVLSGSGMVAAAGGVVNQGTILAQNGTLRLSGAIGGSGQLQVGAASTLDLSAVTVDSEAVSFAGAGGTLVVGAYRGTTTSGTALNQQGVVSGFVQGDTIVFSGNPALTSAVYVAGSNGLGTLNFMAGSTSLGSLTLAGSYTGYGFQVTPGASSFLSNITLTASVAGSGGLNAVAASAGTSSRDVYAWTANGSGLWGNAAAWRDVTTGAVATVAPGSNNVVTLTGLSGTAYQVVTGPGNSASLTLVGNSTLQGSFNTGALQVGTGASAGGLCIGAASGVVAGSASVLNGPLLVSGAGATLRVSGAFTLGAPPSPYDFSFVSNTLSASAGALIQADSLVLQGGALVTDTVTVDAASSLEVGETGSAASGKITVDAGKMIVGTGTLRASNGIANQGTILAQAGTLRVTGAISGSGQVQVGAGGTLDLSNGVSVDQEAVNFTGTNGTLLVGSAAASVVNGKSVPALTQQGAIGGFLPGDTLAYYGQTAVTGAVYQPGTGGQGTLTLLSGANTLGTLTLLGDYSAYSFQVTPGSTPSMSNITLVAMASVMAVAGTVAADAYAWVGASGGNWGDASNWKDTSTGLAASVAAGLNNSVTLGGSTNPVVRGAGNAASLTIAGNATLNGVFQTGQLAVGADRAAATLTVYANTTLAATAGSITNGQVQVAGNGARLSVKGPLALGDSTGGSAVVALSGGGSVQTGNLTLLNAADGVTVDAASTMEIGSAGGAAAGRLTVDAGSVLSGMGSVYAAGGIVDRGTILAQGTLSVGNAVTGLGVLQIAEGATLNFTGTTASTAAVAYQSAVSGRNTGTLGVRSVGPAALNVQGMISGMMLGDTIAYSGTSAVTGVAYRSNGDGTGTLTLNGASGVIGTLSLIGNYAGYGFKVVSSANGTSTIGLAITDPLFDSAYYLAQNPDVAATRMDPYWHYMNVGWKEGRNPDAYFDTKYYLATNPDVAAAVNLPMSPGGGLNPLTHFEFNGWAEGRQPSLMFSDSAYLAANPDIKAAGINPLVHYLNIGKSEGRTTGLPGFDGNLQAADPMVNAAFYDAQLGATLIPAGAAGQAQAAEMYHATGWKAGLNPDAWFDTKYYLAQNPDVKASGMDPLLQFETVGWTQGRDPSLAFSVSKYLAANPDIKAAGIDPLLHYINIGQSEGRMAFLSGSTAAVADPLVDVGYYDKQLGATIIPTGTLAQQQAAASYNATGWQKGLNPDAWFDTNYYLSHNPDIAAAHINPLLHYETQGWLEGRDPSAAFSTHKFLAVYPGVAAQHVDPLLQFVTNGAALGEHAFNV